MKAFKEIFYLFFFFLHWCGCVLSGWRSWRKLWWRCSSWIKTWVTSAHGFLASRLSCRDPSPTASVTNRRSKGDWQSSRWTSQHLMTLLLLLMSNKQFDIFNFFPFFCKPFFSLFLFVLKVLFHSLQLFVCLWLIIHICPLFNLGRGGHMQCLTVLCLWTDV